MKRVTMYTTATCPFCVRAEALLDEYGVTDLEKIRVDLEPARRQEMMRVSGRHTVPQIFIADYHVGGCDELFDLDEAGRLGPLLGSEDSPR